MRACIWQHPQQDDSRCCLPQIVDVPVTKPADKVLHFDEEWLAILRETHDIMNLRRGPTRFPSPFAMAPAAAAEHRVAVATALEASTSGRKVPTAFVQTVDAGKRGQGTPPSDIPRNPQTEALLQLIGRPWNLSHSFEGIVGALLTGDDLLEDDADVSPPDGRPDPMFDALEINNFDPFAYNNAKEAKRPKLSALLEAAAAPAATAPASRDATPFAVCNGSTDAAVPANPEEIDIGSDSD